MATPYPMRREAERADVIGKFEAWLAERKGDAAVRRELERMAAALRRRGEVTLVCWCAPRRCHAEVIARELARMVGGAKIVYLD